MSESIYKPIRGGRTSPPLMLTARAPARLLAALLAAAACVVPVKVSAQNKKETAAEQARKRAAAQAEQQRRAAMEQQRRYQELQRQQNQGQSAHRDGQPLQRPNAPVLRPNQPALRQERAAAVQVMRRMLKPEAPFVGVQETTLYGVGNNSEAPSIQDIEGDMNGSVRITFRSPASVAGDVMIIKPGSFHSYHRAANKLEVAQWPTEWNDEGKRMLQNLQNGSVNAWLAGTETVAGRPASIVELAVPNGAGGQRMVRKLWIDEQTGILLKIQKMNAQGRITSVTQMREISVAPATPINPADFVAQFPGASITPLFPEPQYRSVAEAHVPFTPAEPVNLPPAFHLDGVWEFGPPRAQPFQHSVLLRYTDGVSSFSLYEHLVPPARQSPIERPGMGMFRRAQQFWRIMTPQGEMAVQYIGHLTPLQAEGLYDSLR